MIDKLDMTSPDLVSQNIQNIAQLFPNCVTETSNGLAIDFDMLKQELSKDIVEGNKERYRLEWPGKREAIVTANLPINKTLRPAREESVDFDNTENLYIEGDNLEVLKLLQESYLGKIKMIYIDPPYNTGKDFVYKDNFTQDSDEYQEEAGLKDEYNNRLVANPDTSGRYHSDWLTMMYPRLKLARNLLTDDGVIFISINDKEIHNLKKISDEIFGEKNFLSCFIWNSEGNTDNQLEIKINHEYILCYIKDIKLKGFAIGKVIDPNTRDDSNLHQGFVDNNINKNSPANPPDVIELPIGFPSSEKELFYEKKNLDEDFFKITQSEKYISDEIKRIYDIENLSGLPVKMDNVVVSDYKLQEPCKIYGGFANRNKLKEFIENNFEPVMDGDSPIRFYLNANAAVRYKKENVEPRNILSVLRNFGTTEKSKTYLKNLGIYFSYPKPVDLITYLVKIGCYDDRSIVLDFFAGSTSTAEAIFNLNSENKGFHKFIMVQLPEDTPIDSDARKAGYKNICELGKERIRKTGDLIIDNTKKEISNFDNQLKKLSEELNKELQKIIKNENRIDSLNQEIETINTKLVSKHNVLNNLDKGFRVYKLDSSNMQDVYYTPNQYEQGQLDLLSDNIKPDRNSDDLVAQIMLDWGLPLSLKIEQTKIANKEVFKVADDALLCCFDEGIDEAFAKKIATLKPLRIVFRDKSFKDDTAKENVKQLLKQLSPDSEMKVI